jgi:hypothetical protein
VVTVHLVRCNDIVSLEGGKPDPYVDLELHDPLQHHSDKRRSMVLYNEGHPRSHTIITPCLCRFLCMLDLAFAAADSF